MIGAMRSEPLPSSSLSARSAPKTARLTYTDDLWPFSVEASLIALLVVVGYLGFVVGRL